MEYVIIIKVRYHVKYHELTIRHVYDCMMSVGLYVGNKE